jgi:glycosyltransferase involved in cell wall biosynthesis
VIVVDGGSTDSTGDIIEKNRDIVDVYISEKDAGPYDAANKGILKAKGTWIFWLAADDELLMDPQELLDRPGAEEADVICGSVLKERADGEFVTVCSEADLEKLTVHCSLRQPATLFRREKMIEAGLYDLNYRFAADRELFLRLREKGAAFKITDEVVVRFYYGGLTTSKKVIESYKEDLMISKQYGQNAIAAYGYYGGRVIIFSLKNFIIGIIKK